MVILFIIFRSGKNVDFILRNKLSVLHVKLQETGRHLTEHILYTIKDKDTVIDPFDNINLGVIWQ